MASPAPGGVQEFSSFLFFPIGARRNSPDGRQIRANPALLKLNGHAGEAEQLAEVGDLARVGCRAGAPCRVRPPLDRDGWVRGFESDIHRLRTRERFWIGEDACRPRGSGKACLPRGRGRGDHRAHGDRGGPEARQWLGALNSSQVPGLVSVAHVDHAVQRQCRCESEGIRDIHGLEAEQLVADSTLLSRCRHPDDRERLERDLEHRTDRSFDPGAEFRVGLPDGTVKGMLRRACSASIDDTGQPRVGVLIDVTDHQRVESEPLESEARWRRAMEVAREIRLLRPTQRIVIVTGRGLARMDALGDAIRQLLEP